MTARADGDEARRTILAAIRRNLVASAPFDAERREHEAGRRAPTSAPAASGEPATSALERFRQAFEAVGGRLAVVRGEREAAEAVREILELKRARRVAVSDSPLVERVIRQAQLGDVRLERAPDRAALFDCDAGVTSAQWAVAETGTLVLESDRERHRLASLVPPVHVAIVEAHRIRETLGEVLRATSERGADALSRTLTFVTGPSRTSDIELTLAIGVHGPGEVYVVILEGDDHA